jgi:RNA polymerase sigma-70 factor (ECF subfamily)
MTAARRTPGVRDAPVGLRFDDFYAVHYAQLVVQINAHTGDLHEAQEAVQEAFCRAWPRWETISTYGDPVGWVRRVAWNVATSRWRRARAALSFSRRQRPDVVEGPGPDRVVLTDALAKLPTNQRRAVILHHLAGLSIAEIAAECDVPEGTVKSWLHRGRAALAAQLSSWHRETPAS